MVRPKRDLLKTDCNRFCEGYLPEHKTFEKIVNDQSKNTPVFIGHGDNDHIVSLVNGKKVYETLKRCGVKDVEMKVYNVAPFRSFLSNPHVEGGYAAIQKGDVHKFLDRIFKN